MLVSLLVAALASLLFALPDRDGLRDRFLRAIVFFGAALWFSTEFLGALDQLRQGPVALWWAGVTIVALTFAVRRRTLPGFGWHVEPVAMVSLVGIIAILTLTAVTAAFSPPNSADAMAYHMPRVIYWAEQASVRFFPTPYLNQIMLQPLAEYGMLHTYLLSGGDRYVNVVQWFASLSSIVGVSAVARAMGANPRGQALAAVFCATLPAGILASSGAKNDYVLAMWLIAAVYFALRSDWVFLGGALGLALLTKATAYLFAPWALAAVFAGRKRLAQGAVTAAAIALAINVPQFARNYELSGSIMGFDSAQGDGFFRWRNETFGWRQTISNILRNFSDQMGGRSAAWNETVYERVEAAHRWLGIDVNNPATTWRWSVYGPPVNANHEANAPNRLHLALLAIIACATFFRRERSKTLYVLSLICAFIGFCSYLKWQPFFARLLLPLFVLAAPLAAEIGGNTLVSLAVCAILLNESKHAVLENWVRPLKGPQSVLHRARDVQYFADLTQWRNRASYEGTVSLLEPLHCRTVGIDITNLQLEYPLQALLRERNAEVRFKHMGVQNASARYRPATDAKPCAVVCLDCAGDRKRVALYRDFSSTAVIGKFVVFYDP
jgi:hypothetical protein